MGVPVRGKGVCARTFCQSNPPVRRGHTRHQKKKRKRHSHPHAQSHAPTFTNVSYQQQKQCARAAQSAITTPMCGSFVLVRKWGGLGGIARSAHSNYIHRCYQLCREPLRSSTHTRTTICVHAQTQARALHLQRHRRHNICAVTSIHVQTFCTVVA